MRFEGKKTVETETIVTTISVNSNGVLVHTNDGWTTNLLGATFTTNEEAEKVFNELVAAYPALREDDHYEEDEFNIILDRNEFKEVEDEEA